MLLCAIIERWVAGMASFGMWGWLEPAQLHGGGNIKVRSFSAVTDNIVIGPDNVFMTKRANEHKCALFNAISIEDPGDADNQNINDAECDINMQLKFTNICGDLAGNYAYYLGVLMAARGSMRQAQRSIEAMVNNAVQINNDHLWHRVAVPYYWIIPTCITSFKLTHLHAMQNNIGALVLEGEI